jgi:hypothetical protein
VLAETYVASVDPAYDIVGTGDFDGDGKSDILWRHTTLGDVWIWLMNGPTPLSQVYVARVDLAYAVAGVGDLDGDSNADIVWHNGTTGEVWAWPMSGTTRLSETYVATVPDTDYRIQGLADFTGDGMADLLWHHATLGEVWLWPMNGTAVQSETYVSVVPETAYGIAGSGDYDGDGKADILWHLARRGVGVADERRGGPLPELREVRPGHRLPDRQGEVTAPGGRARSRKARFAGPSRPGRISPTNTGMDHLGAARWSTLCHAACALRWHAWFALPVIVSEDTDDGFRPRSDRDGQSRSIPRPHLADLPRGLDVRFLRSGALLVPPHPDRP